MGSGGGGRINKPKSSLCKKDVRKETRLKVKSLKRLAARGRSDSTLEATTKHMLRQSRTNPKANVLLSGKKKRLLLKEAKRLITEKAKMETCDDKKPKDNITTKESAVMETS